MIDMAMLIAAHKPDAAGSFLPSSIQEGSVTFANAQSDRAFLPTGPGGSASASQTIYINGLAVRSETINYTCTTISLNP